MSGAGRPRVTIPYEAQVFGRMAAFGILVGAAYWFLTYEAAGTVLLGAFGLASAVATVAIALGARRGRRFVPGEPPQSDGTTAEPIPNPGWTPLGIALGLGGLALGATLGPWLLIAGLVVAVIAAKAWLDTAMAETDRARGGARRIDEGR